MIFHPLQAAGALRENVSLRRATSRRRPFVDQIIPKGGIGAELGVYKGHFTRLLLDVARPVRLHAVDPWYHLVPEWDWGTGDRSTVRALSRVLAGFEPEIRAGRLMVHVGFDEPVLEGLPDGSLDWAYIDSTHWYEHTLRELDILSRKIKLSGVIAGDDWRPDPVHPHHGVCRAVQEFVARGGSTLIYAGEQDAQWALQRR